MSFATSTRDRAAPVLPLAGMVDVLFLLLIFFMTASVFREQETAMDISLPSAETATPGREGGAASQIVVTVDKDNRVYLGEREIAMGDLRGVLEDLVAAVGTSDTVVVRADEASRTGVAVRVMDLAQQAGLTQVSIATIRPAEGGE